MRQLTATAIIITLLSTGCYYETQETKFGRKDTVFAAKGEREKPFVSMVPITTDIHYSAKYCTECHVSVPRRGSHKQLRYGGNYQQLCRCHYSSSENYIHPVDIAPSENLKTRIPAAFPLQEGKVTCSTCHDIVVQCQDNQTDKILLKKRKFLRGVPYKTMMEICFKCHNKAEYQRYNPHQQLNAKKEIIKQTCLYCHAEIPDEKHTSLKDAKLIGNMDALCIRCHTLESRQIFHSKHLRKPSDEVLTTIKTMEDQHGILLPLSQEGNITCATCHNPHEKGVIPDRRLGARGASLIRRHRLQHDMCIKCHPMREISVN
ncbi:hypothetical protein ACFL2S_05550 [Thermodesulfobacteriota bacterium]